MANEDDESRWIQKIKGLCSTAHNHSTSELCNQLVSIRKQRLVSLERFRTHLLDRVLLALLAALTAANSTNTLELLYALNATINANGPYCHKHYDALLAVLIPLARQNQESMGYRRQAINSLGNLCHRSGSKMQHRLQAVQEVLVDNLEAVLDVKSRSNNRQLLDSSKLASCTLRALQLVLPEEKPNDMQVDRLMRVLPSYALLHNDDQIGVYPFRLVADTTRSTITSSESEFSETDPNSTGKRDRIRVRQHALACLQHLTKSSPNTVFSHLDRLFQGGPQTGQRTLLMAILEEENATLRMAACQLLMSITNAGKSLFATASERGGQISSFTSLSEKMGVLLRQFHATMIAALQREQDLQCITCILQCASALADNVPYARLSSGHLPRLFDAVLYCTERSCKSVWQSPETEDSARLRNEESTLESEIYQLAMLLPLKQQQQQQPVNNNSTINNSINEQLESTRLLLMDRMNATFTLIQSCFTLSESKQRLTTESYAVVSAIIRTFPDFISTRWTAVNAALQQHLPVQAEARVSALGSVEQFAKIIAIDTTWSIWWEDTVDHLIQANSNDSVGSVRALICDILANLTDGVLEGLTMQRQRFILSLVLAMSADTRPMVQAAACRALGVFVLFSSLHEDIVFLSDAANAILGHAADRSLDVRLRVFWAMANLCDLLAENSTIQTALLNREMYLQLSEAVLNGAKDNVKLRSHAVRAIGGLVLAADELILGAPVRLNDLVQAVCMNVKGGPLKVRWNACHTIGRMFQNPHFPMGDATWTSIVVNTLKEAIKQTKNYKIRIHACGAFRALPSRASFGNSSLFASVIDTVIKALQNVASMGDAKFTEYKYVEQLKQQLIDCGHYLLTIVTEKDKQLLSSSLSALTVLLSSSETIDSTQDVNADI
ncbi:armadillo-type protein [Syncephalis fuscata]|nr:armadillo-type protein [Syncephalis fuscata]